MADNSQFTFEISLSILDHLGRNLYRSFITVLGEAISNAWDANAENVHIYVDRKQNSFIIKDDGDGMSADDFQNKFLKIGYSKRKTGETKSPIKNRPYIGRKGIGKLALLSCAEKIAVISKITGGEYVGGIIDNTGLDKAIIEDLTPDKYKLEKIDLVIFGKYINGHQKGTLIYFDRIKEGIKNSPEYLNKLIAFYFRFSLLDNSFNIFLDDEKITVEHLKDLGKKTQFLWKINEFEDPFIKDELKELKKQSTITIDEPYKGFIASVKKPSYLKVITTDERVTIDLFTNGRLRERDILKYIPSARIVEEYLYGQIHYNGLDDEKDRFSSSREGIIAEDPKFKAFCDSLKDKVMPKIIGDWDLWRTEIREDGDPENKRITKTERKSLELYYSVSEEYKPPDGSANRDRVNSWIKGFTEDAKYNFSSYAECFTSENLIRKYAREKNVEIPHETKEHIKKLREIEADNKQDGNCNIDIRQENNDLSYLDMKYLARLVDRQQGDQNCLPTDAKSYKPIRDALMHTALLTNEAKRKLTTIYDNIKGRLNNLLSI